MVDILFVTDILLSMFAMKFSMAWATNYEDHT